MPQENDSINNELRAPNGVRAWFGRVRSKTVFGSIDPILHPNQILASYYSRTTATLYFIYFVWGIISGFTIIPTLAKAITPEFQDLFSLFLIPIAALACVGATFFPRTGRLELFATAALVALVLIYLTFMLIAALQGDLGRTANFVLSSGMLVIPVSRIAFIYRTLVRDANTKNGRK